MRNWYFMHWLDLLMHKRYWTILRERYLSELNYTDSTFSLANVGNWRAPAAKYREGISPLHTKKASVGKPSAGWMYSHSNSCTTPEIGGGTVMNHFADPASFFQIINICPIVGPHQDLHACAHVFMRVKCSHENTYVLRGCLDRPQRTRTFL